MIRLVHSDYFPMHAKRFIQDACMLMQVLGYVTCTSAKLALHISKIAVESHFRRQGIASALLQVCGCVCNITVPRICMRATQMS